MFHGKHRSTSANRYPAGVRRRACVCARGRNAIQFTRPGLQAGRTSPRRVPTITTMNTSTPAGPAVTFCGAARTVTGSMHLVEADGCKVLLDCGLFQGRRDEARERNTRFPFAPKSL